VEWQDLNRRSPSFREQTMATEPTAGSFVPGLPIDTHHNGVLQVVGLSLARDAVTRKLNHCGASRRCHAVWRGTGEYA
jgi:hypothetical protein